VQRVVRVSPLALGLEVYAGERHQLLLSAEPTAPQIRLVEVKLRRGEEKPSPLSLLMAKYVEGARLTGIAQPELERVLIMSFTGEHGAVRLVCELVGNLSNLVLVNSDGCIMDAAKRVPASINRYREVLPKRPYVPPPPQQKLRPLTASAEELLSRLQELEGPLARRLAQAVAGVSPLLAREVIYRAAGPTVSVTAPDPVLAQRLVAELAALWRLPQTGEWRPGVGLDADGVAKEFAPYQLTHLAGWQPCETISAAAALVLDRPAVATPSTPTTTPPIDGYERARLRLTQLVGELLERRERRLAAMRKALVTPEELALLQFRASAILATAWRIEPGQREVEVTRAEVTGETGADAEQVVHVPLDPQLSPTENARVLFEEYRKRQAAMAELPALMMQVELEIAQLQQADTDIALAADRAQLDEVEALLQEAGYLHTGHKSVSAAAGPLTFQTLDGMQVLVGRNSRQNAEVTFHRAAPDDLWLHAHAVPGSHVIIRCSGQPVSPITLDMAARLAAHYSAARGQEHVSVDYTERKYVHPIAGGGPGMVTYRNERSTVVSPDISELTEARR